MHKTKIFGVHPENGFSNYPTPRFTFGKMKISTLIASENSQKSKKL